MSEKKLSKRPNVVPICLAAFFNDMGSDMLFAFYPVFLVQVLNISEMKILGLIDTLALFLGFIVMPLMGKLADVKGRKHFIWTGYLFLLISRIAQGLSRVWTHLIPSKMLYQIGRGIRNPPREALLADSVPPHQRGQAFGWLGSADTFGAILGPIIGLALFSWLINSGIHVDDAYRWIFFFAAAPTTMSILIIFFGTRDVKQSVKISRSKRPWSLLTIKENKTLLLLTVVGCIFAFWKVSENFMLVSGAKILGLTMEQFWISVILYWFINLTFAPTAFFAGKLSDKIGRKIPVTMGMAVLGIMTIGFAFANSLYVVGLLFMMHGIYQGLFTPSMKAWIADLAPADRRAEMIGTYSMLVGISDIPGPLVFGLLWDVFGLEIPFIVSGIFCIACAVLLTLFIPKEVKYLLKNDPRKA